MSYLYIKAYRLVRFISCIHLNRKDLAVKRGPFMYVFASIRALASLVSYIFIARIL